MEPERKPAWRRAVVTGDAGFIGTTSTPDSLHRLRAHPRFALYEADARLEASAGVRA